MTNVLLINFLTISKKLHQAYQINQISQELCLYESLCDFLYNNSYAIFSYINSDFSKKIQKNILYFILISSLSFLLETLLYYHYYDRRPSVDMPQYSKKHQS